jgi:hypothetical protein
LEREGQGGAVYGKDTELVAPHAGFCIKTKNKLTNAKVRVSRITATAEVLSKMLLAVFHVWRLWF